MMYKYLRDVSRWSLIDVLKWHADENPDSIFLKIVDGHQTTFAELFDRAERMATYFNHLGVKASDPVVLFLQNGEDYLAAWFGLARLKAVPVLLNTELTGSFLQHQLTDSGAKLAVIDQQSLSAFQEISSDLGELETILLASITDKEMPQVTDFEIRDFEDWQGA